nr:integrase, catalytic region, zinc finger, CCHC-type, peptidase aspartic, catalytic [Tanacetum cinerariifolium]
MFDELLNPPPSVDHQAAEVIAPLADVIPPVHADSTGSPSSTMVDQDAPSPSKSHTTIEIQSSVIPQDVEDDNLDMEVAHMTNDLLFGVPIPEVTSIIIGQLSRPVSTWLQLHEKALFCYYDAFLTSMEPKTYKEALTTGRTFSLVGNVCPLTRIVTTTIVLPKEPILIASNTDKPVITLVYSRKSKAAKNVPVVQIVLWYLDFGCSKHMTEDRSQLINFVQKFLSTVKFRNDHVAKIMGYGDYLIGNAKSRRTHKPKSEDTNQEKLYILHMDLCGPMRVAIVNGKKYILVIVDYYSQFTWAKAMATACCTKNRVRNKMHKAFPLLVTEFPLPEKKDATARRNEKPLPERSHCYQCQEETASQRWQ